MRRILPAIERSHPHSQPSMAVLRARAWESVCVGARTRVWARKWLWTWIWTWRRCCLSAILILTLAACSQELYADLDEREANAMIAALARYNINAEKSVLKDGYSLSVPTRYFADSINILSAAGYPQRKYISLNELFGKSGLIPTPFEEHVRYIYGLSEELARTVSLFDGVIESRVHIALPVSGEASNAKVSVFIKYDQQFDYETLIPRIRKFVSDSVEKVLFENVEVLALPGQKSADFYRIRRKLAEERRPVRIIEFALGGAAVACLFLILLFLLRKRGFLAFSHASSAGVSQTSSLTVRQENHDANHGAKGGTKEKISDATSKNP